MEFYCDVMKLVDTFLRWPSEVKGHLALSRKREAANQWTDLNGVRCRWWWYETSWISDFSQLATINGLIKAEKTIKKPPHFIVLSVMLTILSIKTSLSITIGTPKKLFTKCQVRKIQLSNSIIISYSDSMNLFQVFQYLFWLILIRFSAFGSFLSNFSPMSMSLDQL